MHRIDSTTAREDKNGVGKTGFSDNVDLPQHDATYMTPEWCNAVQEEIANVIEAVGGTLNKNDNNQLATAIISLINPVLRAIYHVGSEHTTKNTNYDPAIALLPIFGYETRWELVEGAPYGVANLSDPVDQVINIGGSAAAVAKTRRVWRRLPDVDPIYTLTASSNGVDEGDEITFLLQTEHLQTGDMVGWQLTVDTGTVGLLPNELTGYFAVDAVGEATYTLTVDTSSVSGQKLKMSLFDAPSVYTEVEILKPRLEISLPVAVDDVASPTTHYDYRYYGLKVRCYNTNLHIGEEVTLNLSGSVMPYLYENYNEGNPPTDNASSPLAAASYTGTIPEITSGGFTYLLGIFHQKIYVKSGAPTNLSLTIELVWNGVVVDTASATFHMPE